MPRPLLRPNPLHNHIIHSSPHSTELLAIMLASAFCAQQKAHFICSAQQAKPACIHCEKIKFFKFFKPQKNWQPKFVKNNPIYIPFIYNAKIAHIISLVLVS